MPLPLIVAGYAIGSAVAGGSAAGGLGAFRMRKAKKAIEESRATVEKAEKSTARRRTECEEAFTRLGEAKLLAMQAGLVPFHDAFEKLKDVDLTVETPDEEAPVIDQVRVREAGRVTLSTLDALAGAGVAGAAGAVASAGATAAVGAFATASTGTAISAIGGIAATNATMAWLGGGALAAGGGGMAAGAAVLSGIAAAPAFLVGGVFLHVKGRDALARAEEFEADVEGAVAKHRESQTILKAAAELAIGVQDLVQQFGGIVARESGWLDATASREADWDKLEDSERERTRQLVSLAIALSDLVHTPIIDDEGVLTSAIREAYSRGRVLASVAE